MFCHVLSSSLSRRASATAARGLCTRVGVNGPFPRYFHTSSISAAIDPREELKESKEAARRAMEEPHTLPNDPSTINPPRLTTKEMYPESHPIEATKEIVKQSAKQANPFRESVVDLIKKDHINIGLLYRVFEGVAEPESRFLMGEIVIREICVHSNAEEMEIYPIVEKDIGWDKAERARHDHALVEKILKELDRMKKWTQKYDDLMDEAMVALQKHMEYEEMELLKLFDAEPPERLVELGDRYADAKRIAPTHPHPLAPKKPTVIAKAAKIAAKPIDEVRDSLRFRGIDPDAEAERLRKRGEEIRPPEYIPPPP